MGTVFMVDQTGTFVTADHVITEMLNPPLKDACKSAISFPIGGWKRDPQTNVKWFSFDPGGCQINNASDVAVCRTTDDLSRQQGISFDVATISGERPQDGTAIFFTGFPLQATDPITSIGSVAGYPAEESYSTVMIDKNAWPGASGSPIYLSDGKTLIGMITRTGSGDAAGLSFGIGGVKISAILASARANWEEQKKKQHGTLSPPATQP
jgi:V8-like Glu-specific endopeptidase